MSRGDLENRVRRLEELLRVSLRPLEEKVRATAQGIALTRTGFLGGEGEEPCNGDLVVTVRNIAATGYEVVEGATVVVSRSGVEVASGTTDALGQVAFLGLRGNRTYTVVATLSTDRRKTVNVLVPCDIVTEVTIDLSVLCHGCEIPPVLSVTDSDWGTFDLNFVVFPPGSSLINQWAGCHAPTVSGAKVTLPESDPCGYVRNLASPIVYHYQCGASLPGQFGVLTFVCFGADLKWYPRDLPLPGGACEVLHPDNFGLLANFQDTASTPTSGSCTAGLLANFTTTYNNSSRMCGPYIRPAPSTTRSVNFTISPP